MNNKQVAIVETSAIPSFPYFVLKQEIKAGYGDYIKELAKVKQNYNNYRNGVKFIPEGTAGDYIPSTVRYKLGKSLIDKEARFMFSQTPDINIAPYGIDETEIQQAQQYQKLVDKVLENSNFSKTLLQSAKDCFIGKRIACLVEISEIEGITLSFYNSLQFYYETEYGGETLTKFVTFEAVVDSKSASSRRILVNRYQRINETITLESNLYDGSGNIVEQLIINKQLELDYIPAKVIVNDGTLEEKKGISEIESIEEYEQWYSKIANADIDSERKGMNPIRYTVDMHSNTTSNLSSGAGAYWDLHHDDNVDNPNPSVGTLAPQLNHAEPVKITLDRLKTTMYGELDVPNITEETMVGTITSGKALKALYYPLTVRCNEKMKTWLPALQFLINTVIDIARLNVEIVKTIYLVSELAPIQLNIEIEENYALMDDETEEKQVDIEQVNANIMSRKRFNKKWAKKEFKTDEDIDAELLQIAVENNMFDSLSANMGVQTELNKQTTETVVDDNLDGFKTNQTLKDNKVTIKEDLTDE